MEPAALFEQAKLLLDAATAADRFSGSLLVARGGDVLFQAARGYAIQPAVLPNRVDTRFNIASVTKMLTAIAVLRLVAAGKLDLHAPVAAYNPDLPHAAEITTHQLLNHTAGFASYWNDAYRAARSDLRSIAVYLRLFADLPLDFPPGTRYQYGNCGYVLLGALLETLMGLSYYEAMRELVFEPAGMPDTAFFELDLPVPNQAVGYTRQSWHSPEDGQLRANTFLYGVKGSPSEHCYSTVADLYHFFQALLAYRLLDAELTGLCMTSQAASEQPGIAYGYGFHIIDDPKYGRMVGHGGRAMGGDAFAIHYRDLGYTVIVLSNYDRPAARAILNGIGDLLVAERGLPHD